MTDIRGAGFYVINGSDGYPTGAKPLSFDEAIQMTEALVRAGARIKVLYTEGASQTEITRFVSRGIQTELVSGA